jgi:hypothetical protein
MGNTSKKSVTRTTAPARRVRRDSAEAAAPSTVVSISDDQVAALAYRYYVESGFEQGNALSHWLRAESELRRS